MNLVRLDRHVAWRAALLTLLLAWPLILFGRPAYFSDSLSYYKGGKVAVAFEVGKIASLYRAATFQPETATIIGVEPPGASPGEASGARSIPYSVAAYLLSAPDAKMIGLVHGRHLKLESDPENQNGPTAASDGNQPFQWIGQSAYCRA